MVRFAISEIPIAVRPTFWITVGLIGLQNGFQGIDLASWVLAAFIAILLHELGHAFAARAGGADFIEVELYFLGGVTVWSAPTPLSPLRRLGVAAAGSGVGIILGLLAIVPMRWAPLPPAVFVFVQSFVFAALVWGILNWVPIRSLDGGVIVASFFEWLMPKRGKLVAEVALFAFALAALLVALVFQQWFIAAIVGFFGLSGFGAMREAINEVRDERAFGHVWSTVTDAHRSGEFERAAEIAERVVAGARSEEWRNRAHEEAVRNWYLAGVLERAVAASDAWKDADHHASWVAVQAYLDAGRTMDVQRIASPGVVSEPVLAGPLAVVDVMLDNQQRVDELVARFPESLSTYLPMKVSDRISPLDAYSRRQVVALLDRLPDVPLVQRIAATIEAGWGDRALAMIDRLEATPELEALRAHALHVLGEYDQAVELLRELAQTRATVTAQVVAVRTEHLALAEEIGNRLLATDHPDRHVILYNHACVASLTGRRADAVSRTHAAIDAGFTVIRSLNFDPDIAEIRQDPQFPNLRRQAWQQQQVAFGSLHPQ